MSSAGYSGTPLAKKLGIKEGFRVGTVNAPEHLNALLAPIPEGVCLFPADEEEGRFDVILWFTTEIDTLADGFERLTERLKVDGGLWVGWPKQSSPLAGPLREGHVRTAGLAEGVVDNKICAIDEDWSGLRFVFRREDRPDIRARRG